MSEMDSSDTRVPNEPDLYRVGVLLIDGFSLMSYASLVEPLRAANLFSAKRLYEVCNFPAAGDQALSSNGTAVARSDSKAEPGDFDLFLVVAGGEPADFLKPPVAGWLRRLDRHGVTLGGVSGGTLVLAAAGLMENRRMTVHWEHAPVLAEMSPTLIIERSLYVFDRDRVTCAGGIAPMDMMHALIATHHGTAFARLVSDWFMHTDIRPSESVQRSSLIERYGTTNATVLDTIEMMRSHLSDPLDLTQLAAAANVGPRQLNRLFRDKVGRSTMSFYRMLRLEKARNLVRNSSLGMTEIAYATGFASSAHFSKAHSQIFAEPPSALRMRP